MLWTCIWWRRLHKLLIQFNLILGILGKCADGLEVRLATHSRVIDANGKRYQRFPKHKEVHMSHAKKLFQYLEINLDCAEENGIPALYF